MLRSILVLLPLLLVGAQQPAEVSDPFPSVGDGVLLAVGGGGTPLDLLRRALAHAGGAEAQVVVLAQASARDDRGVGTVEMWQELGAQYVVNLDLDEPEVYRAELEAADIIWMPGGSQTRLVAALRAAELEELLRRRLRAGAILGGTSAGAAALPQRMIHGATGDSRIDSSYPKISDGLGLLEGVLLDQHFLARDRFNRLASALLGGEEELAMGIDERTGLWIERGGAEVVGESCVLVMQPGVPSPREPGVRPPVGRFRLLSPGQHWPWREARTKR